MKSLLFGILGLLLAATGFAAPPWLPEEPAEESETRRELFSFRTRFWMTGGSVDTRYQIAIPPELVTPPGEVWYGDTQERGVRGLMVVFFAEFSPIRFLSLETQYGI